MEFFDGGHQWPPVDLTMRAFGWMEIVAMKEGRRARDVEFARTILAEDMARAKGLEEKGLFVEAWRSYGAIASTYTGLIDVSDAERRHHALEGDERFKAARRIEDRVDRREREQTTVLADALGRLNGEGVPLVAELRGRLNLDDLLKASRGDGYEAASASRSLALIRIQLSTIARDFEANHNPRADVVQKVLDSIK